MALDRFFAASREDWRAWLEQNHSSSREVWLVFTRRGSEDPCISYDESVEEALCFGWIDSIIRRLDDVRYARKFTPRKPGSAWSETNRKRALKVVSEGRMTPAGQTLIDRAMASGTWFGAKTRPAVDDDAVPVELGTLLAACPAGMSFFDSLPPSCRRRFNLWVASAARQETRARRAAEALSLLERGERLGLK
jgi:uncharacterized protein YdeI (YjbR/CyaY-like superfamily)